VVIGGGQAGLAAGYHLRRLGLDFVILDAQTTPGGAWQHAWDSLRLFSPAAYSSLPGRLMPPQEGEEYPEAGHVVSYLRDYEKRYELPIRRPVRVTTARRRAQDAGRLDTGGVASLGDIVAVPSVRAARDAGLLTAQPMFSRLTHDGVVWPDGTSAQADAIIWCTGFRPALSHLALLGLRGARGHVVTHGTRAADEPRLHLLGYGDWTGPASATLIGVGRPARDAAREISALLAAEAT
jgi:glycine/D-amino acid oxidase-like deaminating enzyme